MAMEPKTSKRGRPFGAKSKRTLSTEAIQNASLTAQKAGGTGYVPGDVDITKLETPNGADYIGESLNAMGEALGVFLQLARIEKRQEQRVALYQNVVVVADKLGPYRYSKRALVHTAGEKNNALDRMGITEQEVYAEVMADIIESGQLPRAVKAYLSKPVAKDGGGGGNKGGVANR